LRIGAQSGHGAERPSPQTRLRSPGVFRRLPVRLRDRTILGYLFAAAWHAHDIGRQYGATPAPCPSMFRLTPQSSATRVFRTGRKNSTSIAARSSAARACRLTFRRAVSLALGKATTLGSRSTYGDPHRGRYRAVKRSLSCPGGLPRPRYLGPGVPRLRRPGSRVQRLGVNEACLKAAGIDGSIEARD
jgi:hypothetical protein